MRVTRKYILKIWHNSVTNLRYEVSLVTESELASATMRVLWRTLSNGSGKTSVDKHLNLCYVKKNS